MRDLKAVAVFCGSNAGQGDDYSRAAATLGEALAARGISVIYGGTHKGLMGVLADAALAAGGEVRGVITRRLFEKGHLHPGLSLQETVATMALRKTRMLELADACIALPGGIGTTEEFMEAWTLNQLGDVDKPVGLLNVNGYYEPFLAFIDKMVEERFLPAEHGRSLCVAAEPEALISLLERYSQPTTPKWL